MAKRKYPILTRGEAIQYGKYVAARRRQEDRGIEFRGPTLSPAGFRNAITIERQIGRERGFVKAIVDATRTLPESRVNKIVEGIQQSGDRLRWQRVPGIKRERSGRLTVDPDVIASDPKRFFDALRRYARKGIDPSIGESNAKRKEKEMIDEILSPKETEI